MTVILARKNCIFEREGPRHHIIFITIKLNAKAIYSTLYLPAIKKLDAILLFCTHAQCMSHDIPLTTKIVKVDRPLRHSLRP